MINIVGKLVDENLNISHQNRVALPDSPEPVRRPAAAPVQHLDLAREVERIHRRYLDLLRTELSKLGIDEVSPAQVLMLFTTWLFLQGSWEQTIINLNVKSPSAGISMGMFYGVGVVFSISVGVIILHDLYRVVTGRISEEELVMVKESEELEEVEELQKELAAHEAAATHPAKSR